MNKMNLILATSLVLTTQFGWAASNKTTSSLSTQVTTKSPSRISVNLEPLYLFIGGVGAKAEYFMTERVSVGIGGMYIPERTSTASSSDPNSVSSYNYRFSRNEINAGANIMLTGRLTSNGTYLNPTVGYQNSRISDFGTNKLAADYSSPQAAMTVGYQWVNPENNIRFALGGGLRMLQSKDIVVKDGSGAEVYRQASSSGSGLALDFQLGYIF